MKKTLALLLTISLLFATSVTAFATDSTVPVDLTVETPIFSVTVPTSLPITLTETGEVIVASNAVITNNSAGPVVVKGIDTRGINGWSTTDYNGLDIKSAKVGSKNVGLSLKIGASDTLTTGADTNNFAGSIGLVKGQSLPLIYDAKVPAQKVATASNQIAEVVFTIGWDE